MSVKRAGPGGTAEARVKGRGNSLLKLAGCVGMRIGHRHFLSVPPQAPSN